MPELPPAAVEALRQARPDMPAMLKAMYPNNNVGRRPPTAEQALYIIEQYMVAAIQASHQFDVVKVSAVREGDELTIRVVPA
jgi:hypothetical protein